MYTVARQGVQVHRQGGGQRFTFTSTHFSDFAVVQRHAADQLHIKVAHFHAALGAFAHYSKSLGQDGVQGLALGNAVFEFLRFGAQRFIAQAFKGRLHRVDLGGSFAVLLEQPVIAAAENFGEEVGGHACGSTTDAQSTSSNHNP